VGAIDNVAQQDAGAGDRFRQRQVEDRQAEADRPDRRFDRPLAASRSAGFLRLLRVGGRRRRTSPLKGCA
jgi:hypothetical protein